MTELAEDRDLDGPKRHTTPSPASETRPHGPFLGASPAAVVVHLLTLVAGLAFMVHEDHPRLWFFGDDWDFIVNRGLHHPLESVWQPHNEHWSTLPILLYRVLYSAFGLHYLPYLLAALVAHLVLAHLIWRTCLREGVDAWVATALVAVFVVLGSGAENLTWAFQVGFVASLLFGYVALELARRRPSWSTDILVALALLAALMCSTIGDVMVIALGFYLVLARRRWTALRPLVLPVACYALWYGLVGRNAVSADHLSSSGLVHVPHFVWRGLAGALGATADAARVGSGLLLVLLLWTALRLRVLLRSHPAVLGLALAAVGFFTLTGFGRQSIGQPNSSRYVYIAIALLLPLVATLVSIPFGRVSLRIPAITVAVALLVVNIGLFRRFADQRVVLVSTVKQQILSTATLVSQGAAAVNERPIPYSGDLTTGEMRHFVAIGQLPRVAVTPQQRLVDEAAMGVAWGAQRLVPGALAVGATAGVVELPATGGCRAFQPTGPHPRIELVGPGGAGAVAIHARPGSAVPTFVHGGLGTAPGPTVTAGPAGWVVLSADLAGANLVVALPSGTTSLCPAP